MSDSEQNVGLLNKQNNRVDNLIKKYRRAPKDISK